MPISANNRKCIQQRCIVVCLFVGAVVGSGFLASNHAVASCGDYLLHGPVDLSATSDRSQSAEALLFHPIADPGASDSESSDRSPSSPCENGRCQSAPPYPPSNSPTRAVHDKQPVTLEVAGLSSIGPDSSDWTRAADGQRPDGPWIPVDLPPPKRARSYV